jgi:hypothetical protein
MHICQTSALLDALHPVEEMPTLRAAALAFLAHTPTLPLPGQGRTLERWRALAALGAEDLWLAKVLEAHFDAQAICAELTQEAIGSRELWAVWAAEPPGVSLEFVSAAAPGGVLKGEKAWCSGADLVTHALVTATRGQERVLCKIALAGRELDYDTGRWQAVGMAGITSGTLKLTGLGADQVGMPGEYLSRPGFWHGGAGIAACWFGAAAAIAERVRTDRRVASSSHAAAHLGAMDAGLSAARALMRETAALIDHRPTDAHRHDVIRLRSLMDTVGTDVIARAGRALGAGPLCTEASFARRCADLTTFMRQSHAEADAQALGEGLGEGKEHPWTL